MPTPRLKPVPIPTRGASDAAEFVNQPAGTTPLQCRRNVRRDGRRMRQRPAWRKLFPARMGNGGAVQALGVITRAAGVSGYRLDAGVDMGAGISIPVSAVTGQVWQLDDAPSIRASYSFDLTGLGGPANASCNAVAISPDGLYIAVCANWQPTAGGRFRTTVRLLSASTMALLSEATVSDGAADVVTNTLTFSAEYLFAPGNQYLRSWSYKRVGPGIFGDFANFAMGGWSNEVIRARVWIDRTGATPVEYVFVAFDGSAMAGVRTGGTIEAGEAALNFRSGIMKLRCNAAAAIPLGGSPTSQVQYGVGLAHADPFWEADHGYWRVSEQSGLKPRGCHITDLAVGPDGSVVFTRTNVGLGPDLATYPPDGTVVDLVSVTRIEPDGTLGFEKDVESLIEVGWGGFFNDIPTGPGDDPTVQAVDINAAGVIAVAGRKNIAGYSAWGFDGSGTMLWFVALVPDGKSVRQAGCCADPSDGNFIFVGDRNNAWDGATGNANWWKRGSTDGGDVEHFDLGAAVSGLGVAALGGMSVYVTDKV